MDYKAVDADSHAQEKPDCWTSRMSTERWGDRVPQLRETGDGKQTWYLDGKPQSGLTRIAMCQAVMPDRWTQPDRWEQVPPSVYEPSERAKSMDAEDVEIEVLYPNVSGAGGDTPFKEKKDPEFEAACVRAYNDMLMEEWQPTGRFVPLCIVPRLDRDMMLEEAKRCIKNGFKGIIGFAAPHMMGMPHNSDSYWDPFWSLCEETDTPVHFHGSTGGVTLRLEVTFTPDGRPVYNDRRTYGISTSSSFGIQGQLAPNFLFSGVLERFPKLTVVWAESGLGWVHFVLQMCDYEWERNKLHKHGFPNRPSEVFKQHSYIDFWYEQASLQARHYIGVDRILWETDFPHPTSLWPDSKKYLEWSMEGIPDDERRQILVENPKRLYKL